MNAVTTEGPIAISVEASHWQNYESGVFDGCNQVYHPTVTGREQES